MKAHPSPYPADIFPKLAALEEGHWWFRARNELLLWIIQNKIRPFREFLEIGCGTGFVLQNLSRHFPGTNFHGSEYYEEGLAFARRRVPTAQFSRLDASQMEDKEKYDVIGAFDVLEHIREDQKTLANLARALRPGGFLVITVPQHMWLWSSVDEQAHHIRRYTSPDLGKKLVHGGFKLVYRTSFVSLLVPLMWLVRRKVVGKNYDPLIEFRLFPWVNGMLRAVMKVEFGLLRCGIRLPVGGSLLVVAQKT